MALFKLVLERARQQHFLSIQMEMQRLDSKRPKLYRSAQK
jgi:hypothetical protein